MSISGPTWVEFSHQMTLALAIVLLPSYGLLLIGTAVNLWQKHRR